MGAALEVREADYRDLTKVPDDRWSRLCVSEGWEPIADICREIRGDLAGTVLDTVDAIRSEIPLYRNSTVPDDDLVASVDRNLDMLLIGIAECRGPTPEEIDVRSALGSRRAYQGFPIGPLLQAYHIGYRRLWRRFLKHADDEEVTRLLLRAATTMWEWAHRVTDGIGRAHAETTRLLAVRAASARQRFLERLLAGEVDSDEVCTLSRSLGFDARGPFRGWVIRDAGSLATLVPRFVAELNLLEGCHRAFPHGPRLIVVSQVPSQHNDFAELKSAIARLFPDAVVGTGLTRDGLAGARLSIGDAERAADAAELAGVHRFETTWLWAVLGRETERLQPVLAEG